TSLVVGPGFKSNSKTYPGYPENPDSHIPRGALGGGRRLIELDFNGDGAAAAAARRIGGLRAIDWFRDDSFYIVEAPGVAGDHVMGLARTAPDKFVLLGGGAAHHAGELRPNPLVPLPAPGIDRARSVRTAGCGHPDPHFCL
ncbi:hypothetical protein BC826DRAFT_1021000, partial [Russula brevipes]